MVEAKNTDPKIDVPARLLDTIDSPTDLQNLSDIELETLAGEIRSEMVDVTSENGGHLAPNLGVVELTIALHLALNSPRDKIVWDVGHQSYVHKLLTGRRQQFHTLRRHKGLSGFPKKIESDHDIFDSGHASNSLSVALGLAVGYQRQKMDRSVAVVIGDGALTGGMAYEALNQAGHLKTNLIVILNDNKMSIDGNVGAMSSYLNRLRLDPTYNCFRDEMEQLIKRIPAVGERVVSLGESLRASLKQLLVPGMIFEELGFKYIGPVDGHNISAVRQSIDRAKQIGGPIVIHTLTQKGRGYAPAQECPDRFHGTGAFDVASGAPKPAANKAPTYTSVFGATLMELAPRNKRIVGITAAMSAGTGLEAFAAKYPDRFYDVGIAEQHAVTFAAGLALAGYQPVVAIYSTFLQRAFDQIVQDVCLQNLPVIFIVDRGGLVGDDGPTHHGAFDLSYLTQIPNMVVMTPKDENELRQMVYTATKIGRPTAIRYPRGAGLGVPIDKQFSALTVGKSEVLFPGKDVCLIAAGRMVAVAREVSELLSTAGIDATLINARFIKPLDERLITGLVSTHPLVVTLEDNSLIGGFGAAVSQLLADNSGVKVLSFGLPDTFIGHGSVEELFNELGLRAETITGRILEIVKSKEVKIRSNTG